MQLSQTNTSSASSINQSVTPVLLPEQNCKDVNDIYISLLNGVAADSVQLQTLESIAAQCPAQGGIAVYRARVLLNLIYDDVRTWDDNCPPSQRLAPESSDPASSSSSALLYPNPNDGNMVLAYTLPDDQPGAFTLYDAMGNIVDVETLIAVSQKQSILLPGLASGIYFYQVTCGNSIITADKIAVQK